MAIDVSRKSVRWALLVGGLALAVRLGYLFEIENTPLFHAPVADAAHYLDDARYLTEVSWAGRPEPFRQPPLYPYLLAAVRSLSESPWLPRLLQAALGAASCGLLVVVGRRLFPAPVALAAGLAAALYGPFVYFSGELLSVTLATFLLLFLLWILLRTPAGPAWRWVLPGMVMGLAALTAASVLLLAPFVLWWLWRFPPKREARGRSWQRGLWFAAGCALMVAPVTVRNLLVGGDLVLLAHNGGIEYYIGNNPDHDRTVAIRPGEEWNRLLDTPRREAGIERPSARSRYFLERSWEFVRGDPWTWAGLMARKAYLFWRGEEIPRNLDPYFARADSRILAVLLWDRGLAFPFGLVAPLALAGLVFCLRRRTGDAMGAAAGRSREGTLVVGFVTVYAAAVVLFYVTSRDRLPVVPPLLLVACYGAFVLTRRPTHWGGLAATALAGVALNAGPPLSVASPAHEHYWRGQALEEQGRPVGAAREYRAALRLDPGLPEALARLAALEIERGNANAAVDLYRRGLAIAPDSVPLRRDLAAALLSGGRSVEAVAEYERLVDMRPGRPDLHGSLAYARLMAGRPAAAARAYRRVLELRPDSLLVRYQLARLHQTQGRPDSAAAHYRVLLAAEGRRARAHLGLGEALVELASEGRTGVSLDETPRTLQAEHHLRRAVRLDSTSLHARWSLGLLLARQSHRYADAVPHFERILELAPGDHAAHLFLGHLYQRTGRSEAAAAQFERYSAAKRRRRMQSEAQAQTRGLVEQLFEKGGG